MSTATRVHEVQLGFLPPSHAIADPDHPGLLRAGERSGAPYGSDGVEFHACPATDLVDASEGAVDLLRSGFDVVDLSPFDELQSVLARVAAAGSVAEVDATEIRTAIDGSVLSCSSGATLKVRFLAGEGLFMRTAGPNRMSVVPTSPNGMNDHGAATSVHIDQDVYGTPLTQVMDGRAPELFRHDSPDGHNHDAALMLVNLWIPLQQITQPLVLADGATVDRRRHQLRFGLRTESFLERSDDMAINDIWRLMHGEDQRWYFRSEMDHRRAYVFDTLSTAHGAGVLPGEEVAERYYRALDAAETAIASGDTAGVTGVLAAVDATSGATVDMTDPLRDAVDQMTALLDEVAADPSAFVGSVGQDWIARARAARRRVVRMSIEMRVVVSVVSQD